MMDSVHEKRRFSRSKLTVIYYPKVLGHGIVLRMDIFCHEIRCSSVHSSRLSQKSKVPKQPSFRIKGWSGPTISCITRTSDPTRTKDSKRNHARDEEILQAVQHETMTRDPTPTDSVEPPGVPMDAGVTIAVKVFKDV
jgi:hypothetical protein